MNLTTIMYRQGEWSPKLLREDVRVQYRYCEVPMEASGLPSSKKDNCLEYAKRLKCTMIQNDIDPQNALYIAASDESLRAAQMQGLALLGYAKPNKCDAPSLSNVKMLVEGFEEVDALFLERVYEREHQLPWVIATNPRWILREFTMDDMDGLVELYDQPGVAYRIVNGQRLPGYIEPLLPREEEEEYQRCYIENMYGYYGYGMWLVVEPVETDADQGKCAGKIKSCGTHLIGRAGLEHREYENGVELEMGYVIDPLWQHQGIAYEVCLAIMEYAAEYTEFKRLNALTEADNTASIALLEKLGFTYLEDTDVSGIMTRRYVCNLQSCRSNDWHDTK